MNSSSKNPKDCNNTFIGIWKSPNTDNVVKNYNYDNGKYVDYQLQSIFAKSFYEHIISLRCHIEIPESNLTINEPKDNVNELGTTIVTLDKSNKAVIQLSHTFCYGTLSSINIDYMIPSKPGYLVMVFFGQDSRGKNDIISVLRFHFESTFLPGYESKTATEAHLDSFCGNCDNPNIKGAGSCINIFFDYCKSWNEIYDNKIIQYQLGAIPRAFNYWKRKFGFVPIQSDLNDDELIPMTKPGPIIMEEVVAEPPSVPDTSVPTFTNEQMEAIDWAVTWDELVEGLEQERRHQEEELNQGMSARHRQAWGDDEGFERSRGSLRKSKRAKSKRTIQKTKNKKSPRRGRKKPTGSSSI
jgi:hypothetical protein